MIKKRTKRLLLGTMMILLPLGVCAQQHSTLRRQMEQLQQEQGIHFVYDSSLNIEHPYQGRSLTGMNVKEALRNLFSGTDIEWSMKGSYVMLRPAKKQASIRKNHKEKQYTLSGYVRDGNGESLINATVQCTLTNQPFKTAGYATRAATTTNSYGFYSITLPEGDYEIQASYLGYAEKHKYVNLKKNHHEDFQLKEDNQLQEVVVTGNLNSPVLTTQTGKKTLSRDDLNTEFALLSSPDLIKTLQRSSGVSEGIDVASGLYVHGGNDDENLFLIDGTPIYTMNHAIGLFSAFNTDAVKNVDFYKSGFPARYGGRLSSVTDVRTNDGDMRNTHGSYSIGLTDGRFQIDGPVKTKKERQRMIRGEQDHYSTSYNFGLRRTWLDLITEPIFFIVNKAVDEKIKVHYFLHDLNGKITHVFNNRSRAYFSIYSSKDMLKNTYYWDEVNSMGLPEEYHDIEDDKNHLSWGNLSMTLDWNYQLKPYLFANFSAGYTHNRSIYEYFEDWRYGKEGRMSIDHIERKYRSTIYDATLRADFDYRPAVRHHIRFGGNLTWHDFRPQTQSRHQFAGSENLPMDTVNTNSRHHMKAQELNLYAEDEMRLTDIWSINIGMHATLFNIPGKTFFLLDPRAAFKYQINSGTSVKLSFTEMTQTIHRMSSTYLSMPTDYWVPTTSRLKPMHSYQVAAGLYTQIDKHWFASLEGYYKLSTHMLQYTNFNSLTPPVRHWDSFVMDGKGLFYGIEADVRYHDQFFDLQGSYTLSWNKRKFDEFYPRWYYDKFDNRHKINITGRMRISNKAEMYAGWTYHTGYRMTIPKQHTQLPTLPPGLSTGNDIWETGFNYEEPNNVAMPAYHRLDLGFNLHHTTKHGHERIWNISIYNAYCRLNAMYISTDKDTDGTPKFKSYGFIPIIPTASYTIKF